MASIHIDIQTNGDLLITVADPDDFEEIFQKDFQDERAYLFELMDDSGYIGNNWHCCYNIGLSEAPAIGQGAIYNEKEDDNFNNGLPVDYENLWYFPDYMIKSYLVILQKEGQVIFTGHKDNKIQEQENND